MLALDTAALTRASGWSTLIAIVALIVSGITIALFFGGAGAFWGPINDLATAITLVAMILPVLAIDRLATPGAGTWLRVVTVGALAGLVLGAVGQVLLVLGVIDLQTSFVTGGVGIAPFFAWLVALPILAFGSIGGASLPGSVGWLALAVICLSIAAAVVGMVATGGPILWITGIALLVGLLAWLAALASTLLSRTASV